MCGRLRLGRRGGEHGVPVERPDAGDRASILRHAGRGGAARHGVPVHRAARGQGLDAARRVRRPDCRPDGLPVQRLASAGVAGRQPDGPAHELPQQPVVPQRRHGDAELLQRLRHAGGPVAERVGHARRHIGHPQGAAGYPGRQAPRLQGAVHGPLPAAEQGFGGLRGVGPAPVARGPRRRRSRQERAGGAVAAPRLRALPLAEPVRALSTGPR